MARSSRPSEETSTDKSNSYEGLARRYRPQTFEDVVGQRHVVGTLVKAVELRRWASAYLFVGGRGLGKTTMARLLAKAVNCEKGPTPLPCGSCAICTDIAAGRDIDVFEIDAASNTGVDHVRDTIIQAVSTSPARGRARIFIIDEVHMLSTAAFNALLKTIEEPPPNVLFILATTDAHKVPPTIRSRCQRFDFRPLSVEELSLRLKKIADREKIRIDDDALGLICDYAEGGVRDALSALDLIRSYAADQISLASAEEALGVVSSQSVGKLLERIRSGDADGLMIELAGIMDAGGDSGEVMRGLINSFRRLLVNDVEGRKTDFTRARILRSLEAILESAERSRHGRHARLELELLLCRLAGFHRDEISLREIYDRLIELETSAPASPSAPSIPKSSPASAPTPIPTSTSVPVPTAAGKPFSAGEFLSRLTEVSTLAATLLENADMKFSGDDLLTISLDKSFAYDRFQKDQSLQVTVAKVLESMLGRRIKLAWTLSSAPAPAAPPSEVAPASSAPPTDKKQKRDPKLESEIDRIKNLFGVEVVEVIEEN
ncbi:MAG: DNA polymerase III subunit gamma/tau [Candidatus Hydrogenedentota bacterium]